MGEPLLTIGKYCMHNGDAKMMESVMELENCVVKQTISSAKNLKIAADKNLY